MVQSKRIMKHIILTALAAVAITTTAMAKLQIETTITIDAPIEVVWAEFANTAAYPDWNPLFQKLEGEWIVGQKLDAVIDGMGFKPKVLVSDLHQELTWRGRVLLPGLFDGTHSFVFTDNGNGTTTLVHKESFRGILVPLMKKKLEVDTKALFEQMNVALKERAETLVR